MANPLPYKELGRDLHSRHVIKMPDASKEPIFNDFDSLIEQAVSYQKASFYSELPQKIQRALAIAALREDKTLAIDAEYEGFNELLAEVFENNGSQESLQKLYQYLIGIVIEGNSQYDAQVAYCVDNALEKEEDKQALYSTFGDDSEYDFNQEGYLQEVTYG